MDTLGKMIARRLCAVVVLGATCSADAGRTTDLLKPAAIAESLPADVAVVSVGGTWQQGGEYGTYRLVAISRGVEHVQTYFFAQWLKFDEQAGRDVVLRSVPVDELNRRYQVVQSILFDYERRKTNNATFHVVIYDRAFGRNQKVDVHLGKAGEVRSVVDGPAESK